MKLLLTTGALAVAASTQALAWGNEGHRIVCEIAYHEAAASTRAKIDSVLAANGESGRGAGPHRRDHHGRRLRLNRFQARGLGQRVVRHRDCGCHRHAPARDAR
jgi:hypothetical protein